MKKDELNGLAQRVRAHVIGMSGNGGCFLGASLSAVDMIVYLYNEVIYMPEHSDPDRDYFFLSKGHDVPALYGMFVELGFIGEERLANHLSPTDSIYWHPNVEIPGIEHHSGSLGHLLPVSVGVALDMKMRHSSNRVFVMTGDGELDEGSNWEALLVASAYRLDNLTVIVDRNQFQANARTEDLIPLEPLEAKFASFGAFPQTVDGHDFESIDAAFNNLPFNDEGPSVIISTTVRGKGLPSIEARADRWFCNFSDDEVEQLLAELRGEGTAELKSETLTVR